MNKIVRRKKVWVGVSAAVLCAGGVVGTADSAAAELASGQSEFTRALAKVFDGEGGEGGVGIPDLRPAVTFPALTEAQIREMVSGNTIENATFSFRFALDGGFAADIQAERGLSGRWRIENGQLCITANSEKWRLGCHSLVLVVDRVLFFRPNGEARFTGLIKQGHGER